MINEDTAIVFSVVGVALSIILVVSVLGCFKEKTPKSIPITAEPKEVQTIPTAEELVASVKPYKYEDYFSDELVTQTVINCLQDARSILKRDPTTKSTDCYVTNLDSRYRAPSKIFQQYVQNVVSLLEKAHYKVELVEGSEHFPNTRHMQRLKISWK